MKYNAGDGVFQQLVSKDLSAGMPAIQGQRMPFSTACQEVVEGPGKAGRGHGAAVVQDFR
jgi:hypothetical protein